MRVAPAILGQRDHYFFEGLELFIPSVQRSSLLSSAREASMAKHNRASGPQSPKCNRNLCFFHAPQRLTGGSIVTPTWAMPLHFGSMSHLPHRAPRRVNQGAVFKAMMFTTGECH